MMVVFIHVFVALAGVGYTTLAVLRPSRRKLYVAATFVGLTVASGAYLVLSRPVHLAQACVTGVVYLGATSAGLLVARHRLLAAATAKIHRD